MRIVELKDQNYRRSRVARNDFQTPRRPKSQSREAAPTAEDNYKDMRGAPFIRSAKILFRPLGGALAGKIASPLPNVKKHQSGNERGNQEVREFLEKFTDTSRRKRIFALLVECPGCSGLGVIFFGAAFLNGPRSEPRRMK